MVCAHTWCVRCAVFVRCDALVAIPNSAVTGLDTAMPTVMMLKMLRVLPLIHSMRPVMNSGCTDTFSHAFF